VALAGFLLLIVARRFGVLTTAVALQGFGQGLIMPGVTSALSLSVQENEQGPVAGLNSSAQALARMLGPFVGAGLYELDRHYPYVFSSIMLGVLSLVLFWRLRSASSDAESSGGDELARQPGDGEAHRGAGEARNEAGSDLGPDGMGGRGP
jgi:MFS family permease